MIPTGSKADGSGSHFVQNFAVFLKFADDVAMIAGGNTPSSFQKSSTTNSMEGTSSIRDDNSSKPMLGATAVSVSEQAGSAPGESVKTEVFRSEEADGSIVTKTVRTTRRTVESSTGALVTTIEVETTTETESTDGTTSTTVTTSMYEEIEVLDISGDMEIVEYVEEYETYEDNSTPSTIHLSTVPFTDTSMETAYRIVTSVTSAQSTEESEQTTTYTTETPYTTVTSEVVAEVPSSTQVTSETTQTPYTTVTSEVTSAPSIEESEQTTTYTTETSEVVAEVPSSTQVTSETTETPYTTVASEWLARSRNGGKLLHAAIASTCESEGEFARSTNKVSKKDTHTRKKAINASVGVPHSSVDADLTPSARAAAAWGEEIGSVSTVTAHLSKCIQALVVHRGHSVRLAFEDLSCAGQVNESSKEATEVVKGVTGYAESGMMTAVIGAGRAGKTAFLAALAGEGCWFGDEHAVWHGTTMVREAMCLSAGLRQGDDILESRKLETVEACLELLGLTELADQHIASCSAVETSLVAIGVELAFAPSVLLLDEPTRGLDEKSVHRIVRVLDLLAHTGRSW
ncbi:hypothetical protein PHYPSEUDO_013666 [Phytophthora pseudosyringae]|uniref:ABC transporter domain-containing protein n=1 Tax=Phytophthora pseudosyringae TaxID=221518 RepID=A0A8T1V8D8_9STRA|nr:hypothetical protein PHYPSEUDO_013666 [Phytophthora pseudosyringae]